MVVEEFHDQKIIYHLNIDEEVNNILMHLSSLKTIKTNRVIKGTTLVGAFYIFSLAFYSYLFHILFAWIFLLLSIGFAAIGLGQFTRNYTQTVKRAADNKRRYAPGWVHSTCLLRGFPKGAAPHLAHDFAEQSVVCYTLCRRCPENTVAAGEGKGI